VEKGDVKTSRKVTNPGFLELLERMRGGDYRPLAKSYVVSRQQSYRGHWARVVYYAYPKFTKELEGHGAEKIKAYYEGQYKACAATADFPWLDTYREITDSPEEMMRYRLQVYAVDMPAGYVVVNFFREECVDGRRVVPAAAADVFDRETGARLSLGDVIDVEESAGAVNKSVADYLKMHGIRPGAPYDVREAQDQAFSVTTEGLTLLFAPGALAPEAYGLIQIPLALTY